MESESLEGGPQVDPQIEPQIDPVAARPLDLEIEGMTCASCVARVERSLAAVPGVSEEASIWRPDGRGSRPARRSRLSPWWRLWHRPVTKLT